MSEANRLNSVLAARAPAVARCLSPLGRAVAFPKGIPFQASQARSARLNGTIGQVTDGAGAPLPLPSMALAAAPLDPATTFLYSPQPGHPALRTLWRDRQLEAAGRRTAPTTLPFATHGLTHGLGLIIDLFGDADTTVIVPELAWENYELLVTLRSGATLERYRQFRAGAFDPLAVGDAAATTSSSKRIVFLNFPSNPTGYVPTPDEADTLVDHLLAAPGPSVIVTDDAYQGVVHVPGREPRSLFWRLLDRHDPERHVILKVDGATKELLFFASRIGFLTAGMVDDDAEEALTSKINAIVRGTVGGPPGASQALILEALGNPERTAHETASRLAELTTRYDALRDALDTHGLHALPFHGAYFATILLGPDRDAEQVRLRLLAERSVGVIALPEANGLRIAYCSTRRDDVTAIVAHVADLL